MPNGISESLKNIIDSFQHPFYVIDIKSYKIVFANKACAFGDLAENVTCHLRTHKSNTPCSGEHVCPIDEVKIDISCGVAEVIVVKVIFPVCTVLIDIFHHRIYYVA